MSEAFILSLAFPQTAHSFERCPKRISRFRQIYVGSLRHGRMTPPQEHKNRRDTVLAQLAGA